MPSSIHDETKCKVIFKPVCECGYAFEYIAYKCPEELPWGYTDRVTFIKPTGFHPTYCPNCKRMISGFILPITNVDRLIYDERETL